MNSKTKGAGYEREVQTYLESTGWSVFRVHQRPIWLPDRQTGKMRLVTVGADIFGCDIVARKAGCKTKWVQVSVDGYKSRKEETLRAYPMNLEHEEYQIWLRVHGKRLFRVYAATIDGATGSIGFSEIEPVTLNAKE